MPTEFGMVDHFVLLQINRCCFVLVAKRRKMISPGISAAKVVPVLRQVKDLV